MTPTEFTIDIAREGLLRFGYTEREAAFLRRVGLHSGYFLRRQYVQFLGKSVGGTAAALIEKALAHEHIKVCTYVGTTHVYHLCSRRFYAALGQGENRNRRDRQPLTIKSKLMSLDFVLEHPDGQYLGTDREKIDYFIGTLNIHPQVLPAKLYRAQDGVRQTARYFVEKWPIYIAASPDGNPSEVAFCYVDAGATSVSGFETYLDHYQPLFRALPLFRVVYVAARPLLFNAAERLFHRFIQNPSPAKAGVDAALPGPLRSYFETRWLYETGDLTSFDRAKLLDLRDQRLQFSGPETEALYLRWRTARERDGEVGAEPESAPAGPLRGAFSVCLLEHNYDVFGNLTAF